MKISRKSRVPMSEQLKLINECRKSGMTDAEWCREHNISPSTFYNWISRCRKAAAGKILEPGYGHSDCPRPRQDIVPVKIVPDTIPEQILSENLPGPAEPYLDNSHTIEIKMKDLTIRISNGADPVLLTRTLRILQEAAC